MNRNYKKSIAVMVKKISRAWMPEYMKEKQKGEHK
jgi:hypothetical protein